MILEMHEFNDEASQYFEKIVGLVDPCQVAGRDDP